MLITEPPAGRCPAATAVRRSGPFKFTAIVLSNSDSVIPPSDGGTGAVPALLTTPPPAPPVAPPPGPPPAQRARLGRPRLARLGLPAGHHHVSTRRGEAQRDRPP